jgi:alkylation response protein AidB-like acyl-CoA dehydrogenase
MRNAWTNLPGRVDLTLSPSEESFRDELRVWLGANHPGPSPEGDDAGFAFRRAWQRQLHDAGWAGVSWPTEYGGRGATLVEQAIYNEEFVRAQAPSAANVLGLAMGGPTVIAHGSEVQKRRYLEPILSAEEIWCQGFSEPDSGSDLASVKTRGVRDGDDWLVTGQKVWTTLAHHAKWCMLLARTDPDAGGAGKHSGLTYFIMDMEQEAVQVRPLRQITGEAEFNELFIEEARIPDENVIGGVGNGWAVAITTLMHERATLAFGLQIAVKLALGQLIGEAKAAGSTSDAQVRDRFAQLYIEAEVLRLTASRGLTQQMKTGIPGPEGSLVKWQWSDTNQAMTELATEVRGPEGPVVDDEWTYRFLRARANSIEGGTTEILRNIVAERVIGLPRMR